MNVVLDTASMFAKINLAITAAETAGDVIGKITVTPPEMKEFLDTPQFKIYVDKHYAGYELPIPLGIAPTKPETAPASCWYRGIKIVTVKP